MAIQSGDFVSLNSTQGNSGTNTGSDLATVLSQVLNNGQMQNQPQIYGGFNWATLDAQAAVARETQRRVEMDLARNDPYYKASAEGLAALKDFEANPADAILGSPSYQFAVDQADRSLAARQAAQGGLYSGETLKGAAQYATDLANQYYGDEWMRRFQRAYSGTPHGWTPQGGAADYPDLKTMQQKYGDMVTGGAGGAGDNRQDLVWKINPDGTISTELDSAYKYQSIWNDPKHGVFTTMGAAQAAANDWLSQGRPGGDYYGWTGGTMWGQGSSQAPTADATGWNKSQAPAITSGPITWGPAAPGDQTAEYLNARAGYDVKTFGQIPTLDQWASGQWAENSPYYNKPVAGKISIT